MSGLTPSFMSNIPSFRVIRAIKMLIIDTKMSLSSTSAPEVKRGPIWTKSKAFSP